MIPAAPQSGSDGPSVDAPGQTDAPRPAAGYAGHFGLRCLPFENVPDPAFFFNQGDYLRVRQRITGALDAGRGLMVVAGPIGSGKTTLSQRLMADLPAGTLNLWLAEPPATDREILQALLRRLGYPIEWESRVLALGALRDRLLEIRDRGGRFLLVVDESHKFADEGLETIRLLNNLEEGPSKLLQVLLLGQEELTEMLTRAGREAFRQRIANFEILGRMSPAQVRDYVHHRLRLAGGDPSLMPDPLIEAIAEAAEGIPRLTNSLCDRSLLYACENRRDRVDAKDLLRAAEDLGLYRKVFHRIVAQGRTEAAPAAASPDAAPAAGAAPEAAAFFFADAPAADQPTAAPQTESSDPLEAPPRRLAGPLAFLGAGVAALAASLLFYCARATAIYGGDCLSHLVQDVLRR